jgi:streptomycin 6-kinase
MLPLPAALRDGAARTPEGAAWVAGLPVLVARAVDRWSLVPGEPFASGSASWCAPVRDADGRDRVLKISFPHDEARHEATVLRAWAGRGAVALLDADAGDWALLLDRVRPGTPMRAVRSPVPRRLAAAADVLRDLHAAPVPARVPALPDVTAGWADLLEDRAGRAARAGVPLDPARLRAALDVLRAPAVARPVLLHGDLNPGNLLLGTDGWVAIDPKAAVGDPAADPWPLLEQVGAPRRTPDPVRTLRDRLRLVADRAALDPVAVAGWSLARGTEVALWAWQHGASPAATRRRLRDAGDWARVRDGLTG